MRLVDNIALVTGGASGYGEGIVRRFVAEGATVVIADINETGAQALSEKLGGRTSIVRADVSRIADIETMIDTAIERYGRLDILVNNAGTGQRPEPLENTADDRYDQMFDINMRGVFMACRYAVPIFRRQGHGTIINTASGIALTPRPNLVVYAATKGAVLTFTKALAMELAAEGIRVNALCPAAGDTPMLTEFMGGTESEDKRALFTQSIPMGRLVTGADMGAAAAYLASDDASMVTGTALAVDGGRCI